MHSLPTEGEKLTECRSGKLQQNYSRWALWDSKAKEWWKRNLFRTAPQLESVPPSFYLILAAFFGSVKVRDKISQGTISLLWKVALGKNNYSERSRKYPFTKRSTWNQNEKRWTQSANISNASYLLFKKKKWHKEETLWTFKHQVPCHFPLYSPYLALQFKILLESHQ